MCPCPVAACPRAHPGDGKAIIKVRCMCRYWRIYYCSRPEAHGHGAWELARGSVVIFYMLVHSTFGRFEARAKHVMCVHERELRNQEFRIR